MDVTARFRADISDMQSKMKQIDRSLTDIQGQTKKTSGGFTVMRNAIGTALGGAAIGVIYKAGQAVSNFAKGSVAAAKDARLADDRIRAIATSMGVLDGVMGGSIQRLSDFAGELQNQTGVSDEVIKQAQAIILTFKDVASSAGEAGGMFDRTTTAAVDLAAAGFGSVEGNAKSLARALQDPLKGLTMLGRQGVTFTEAEKEKIKALTESGQLLQAQELIMGAVEKQVGGTAAATMTAGDKMRVAFDEFQETVGRAVLPLIERVQLFIAERIVPALERFVAYLQANVFPVVQSVFNTFRQAVMDTWMQIQNLYNQLLPIAPLFAPIIAGIVGMVAAYKLMTVGQNAIRAMGMALDALKAKQIALNMAVLANPYVAVAALIVGAIAAIGVAFKMIYDRSKVLRDAVAEVVRIFKEVVGTIVGDVIGTFRSLFGEQKKVGGGFSGFGDILQRVADVAGPVLAGAMKFLGTYLKVAGNIIRVVIKAYEVFFTVIKMVANIVRAVFVMAVQRAISILSSLMDRLGPIGAAVKRVGSAIGTAFSNIPALIRGAIQSAVGMVEGLINKSIDAINALIRAYNAIPFVDDVSEIGAFTFSAFEESANAAAKSGVELGNAAAAARYQAMAGVKDWSAYTNALNGNRQQADATGDSLEETGKKGSKTDKVLERLKKQVDQLKEAMTGARDAIKTIGDMAEKKFGEESMIEKAFGKEGDISSAISAYDQLDAALRDYYASLLRAPNLSRKITRQLETERDAQRGALRQAVSDQIGLYRERARIQQAITDLERDYETQVKGINARYDALDKAAEDNIRRIEAHWAGVIPVLENALKAANDAFDRENAVLQDLIRERDAYLSQVASSFRGFVNQISFGDDPGAGQIRAVLEDRLNAVRQFAANIRTLVARGLDATLVQEFISAGVAGAGQAAAALAAGSQSEIDAINRVQAGLAAEIASFGSFGAEQWYNAGIAQQEAIVAPLRTAAQQAQMALDMGNAARASELAAAQAHAEQLKLDRQAELEQARLDYEAQNTALELQMQATNTKIAEGAAELQAQFTGLRETLPIQMHQIGWASANMTLRGFKERYPHLYNKLNQMMTDLANSMRRETTITVKTVYETEFRNAGPDGVRAMGGPVMARKAYLVGERGPEMLVMGSRSGEIIPNHELGSVPSMTGGMGMRGGGAAGTVINLNVNAGMGADGAEVGRLVVDALRQYERRNGPIPVTVTSS